VNHQGRAHCLLVDRLKVIRWIQDAPERYDFETETAAQDVQLDKASRKRSDQGK